jgi:hypothetical protein
MPDDLRRVLSVFERNYRVSSADFYRAHIAGDSFAEQLPAWHREVWAGTYRQWLRIARSERERAGSQPSPRSGSAPPKPRP